MLPDASRITRFFEADLWCTRLSELPASKAGIYRALRIAVRSIRQFSEDQCPLRASALTLLTLLSIVPMFAMAFGIAQGFGLQNAIEREVLNRLAGQEEVARWIMSFAQSLLQTTHGGIIAGIGVALLFWTVLKVLNHIELSLNAIWKTESQRAFSRRVSDYLSFMLVAPILLIISSSLTVMLSQQVGFMSERFEIVGYFHSFILRLLRLSPYVVMWALFTFLYVFMPNTRVRIVSAAVGGIIAGTLTQIFQAAYITFQVGVANYNAVYGSFAALPLFLTWLQASWMIVLLGAELSCAHQNMDWLECEPQISGLNRTTRNLVALWVMQQIARRFAEGDHGSTMEELSRSGGLPILLIRQTLQELEESGLVAAAVARRDIKGGRQTGDPGEMVFQPAVPVTGLTLGEVLDRLQETGRNQLPSQPSAEMESLAVHLKALSETARESPHNRRILDL
jgi:membrane protein